MPSMISGTNIAMIKSRACECDVEVWHYSPNPNPSLGSLPAGLSS
jgi:hypothetical protein